MYLRTLSTAVACAGVLVVAPLALLPSAASAAPPPNGTTNVLALAGSDTIQDVDTALAKRYNGLAANPAPRDRAVNVPALSGGTTTVPGDAFCAARTYASAPTAGQSQAPNGSSAGKAALKLSADNGDGCIDIARSSSARGSTDPSTFEYYGFARDAVSWASYSTSPAPKTLTLTQLRNIYSCKVTNWSQVGGRAGSIQRYVPQDGSGTRSFFISGVLAGADPTSVSTPACPAVKTFQENTGTSVPSVERAKAVLPYSAAQFVAQGNRIVPDARAGVRIGAIGGKNPVLTSGGRFSPNAKVYRDARFAGARDVFHVLDVRSPSYNDAVRFVGFDASGPGALCSGALNSTLTQYGFVPNAELAGAQGTCRLS